MKELFNTIAEVTNKFNIDPVFATSVALIETNGKPYLANGFPVLRFEKHVFLRYLKKNKSVPHLLRKAECLQGCGVETYNKACEIDKKLAMLSTSFGMFQIMGFNFEVVGYSTVEDFVQAMYDSVENQIDAFCKFVVVNKLQNVINEKNYAKFAHQYNGPNYKMNNYDKKLQKNYKTVEAAIKG